MDPYQAETAHPACIQSTRISTKTTTEATSRLMETHPAPTPDTSSSQSNKTKTWRIKTKDKNNNSTIRSISKSFSDRYI